MGLTLPFWVSGQGPNGELLCGTIIRPVPPVPFNNEPVYSDRFDNLYTHSELQEDMYNAAHHCDNIEDFVLNFIDDPAHPFTDEERERVCDVFTYLSTLIQRPLQGERAIISINKGDLPLEQGAIGTAFFPNQCGVGHSLIHQVLFTGQGAGSLIHGRITINNRVAGFYTGADPGAIGADQFDFQTVVLHEALHVMGFGSQITPGGGPQGFFTLWDLNLRNAAGDYLVQSSPVASPDCCVRYEINTAAFGPDWDTNIWDQNCGLNNLRFDVAQLPPVNGEYPNAPMDVSTFRNVLSHLDRGCGSEHYVMNPGIPPGAAGVQRALTATETAILCRLGYDVGSACAPDCIVVAEDDGPVYIGTGGTVTIDVGANDFPSPVLGAPPPNVTFNFLPSCGNTSNITVAHQGGSVFRVLGGTVPGSYTFCYGISSCGGRRCDVGRVTVIVTNPAIAASCQNIGECELVSLGGFELFGSQQEMLRDLTAGAIEGQTSTGFSFGSFTSWYDNTPDLFSNPFGTWWTCNEFPWVTGISTPNGTRAAGMIVRNQGGTNMPEGMALPLCRPVYPGMRGRVTFLAMPPNHCAQTQVRVEFSERPPVAGQVLYNNPGTVGPRTDVHITSHPNTNPVFGTYTVDFYNETNVCWNYLYLSSFSPVPTNFDFGYIFVDDVQLTLENRFEEVFDLSGPTPAPAAPCPGQLVTVEMSICNPPNCGQGGLYENPNIAVQATLPPGLSFVPSADFPTPTIVVSRGSIGLGQCRILRFTALVDNDPALAGQTLPIHFTLNAACYRPLTMGTSVTPTGTLATLSLQVAETSGTANDGILCQGSGASATITATTTGNAYLWSTGATTQSIVVAPSATQSYTVTVTGPGLCPNVGHVSVEVVPCGPSEATCDCPVGQRSYTVGTNMASVTLLSATTLPVLIDSGCLAVKGRLVIDRNGPFEIRNSTVLMDEGAEIEVAPNARLSLRNNIAIRGCTRMWRGIRTQNSALVVTGNRLIRDAEYAVNLAGNIPNALTNISNNTFNRNYVAVYVPPLPTPRGIALSNHLRNNRFLCDSTLLPGYTGQQAIPGNWAWAGAYINDLRGGINFTGTGTLFDGPRNGILAERSTVTVEDNVFQNLSEIQGGAPSTIGSLFNTCVGGNQCFQITVKRAIMNNCRKGIYVLSSSLTADDNHITSTAAPGLLAVEAVSGISALLANSRRITIRRNTITTSVNGIVVGGGFSEQPIFVLDNTVNAIPNAPSFVYPSCIYISNCKGANVSRNTLKSTSATNRYLIGMRLVGAVSCDFIENKVFGSTHGVTDLGGNDNYFLKNEVRPDPYPGGLTTINGYLIENAANFYCGNEANTTALGFQFLGTCERSQGFWCSQMKHSATGLLLWADLTSTPKVFTNIGTQEFTGNNWRYQLPNTNPPVYANVPSFHGADNAQNIILSQFKMAFPVPPWNTAIGQAGPWFSGTLDTVGVDCTECGSTRYPEPPIVSPPPRTGDGPASASTVVPAAPERQTASEGLGNPAQTWMAQQRLYERLLQSPESVAGAPEFGAFLAASDQNALGQLRRVKEKMELGEAEDVQRRAALSQWQDSFEKSLAGLLSMQQSANPDPIALLLKSADAGWYAGKVEESLAQIEAAREARRPGLMAENAAIVPPNILAAHEKALNAVVLEHRLWLGQRPAQAVLDQIKAFADLCPFTDGYAVYAARAWYSFFEPGSFWGISEGCAPGHERVLATAQPKTGLPTLVPNPATDRLLVLLAAPAGDECHFELRDLSGREVLGTQVAVGDLSFDLDVSALRPGLYLYIMRQKGQSPRSGKVTVIR